MGRPVRVLAWHWIPPDTRCTVVFPGGMFILWPLLKWKLFSLRRLKAFRIRRQPRWTMAHFPCDVLAREILHGIRHSHAAVIKGGDVGHQLSLLEQFPEIGHHLPCHMPCELCDCVTPVFKNTFQSMCGRWKDSAFHCHATLSLRNPIHLKHRKERLAISQCPQGVWLDCLVTCFTSQHSPVS